MSGQPVRVTYLGLARSIVDAERESVRAPASLDVAGLLDLLAERHGPQFRQGLFRGNGQLRSFIQVCVDDRDIEELQGLHTPLDRGGEVSIVVGVYPLEGG
jgi:molybdopterin converting factor small subunit